MTRSKKALLNTISSVFEILIQQIITLIVSRKVLATYGSDINGINAVLSNTMAWVLIIEGGLTLASNVALFKSYISMDYATCNSILSATRVLFFRIGLLIFGIGIVAAVLAPVVIKSDVPNIDVMAMFLFMSAGTSFSIIFTRKYTLMFSVSQREYLKTLSAVGINIVTNCIVYYVAVSQANYLYIRAIYFVGVIMLGIVTALIVRKLFPHADYHSTPNFTAIKGTRDIVLQKFVALIRESMPLFFLSVAISTSAASVYSVYMLVFGFLRKLCLMAITASQSGLGQLIAEKEPKQIYSVFRVFEFAVITVLYFLMSVTIPLVIPFIQFYTHGVHDIDYINWGFMYLMAAIIFVQTLHIPSGVVMLMAGYFQKARDFQIITLFSLLLGSVLGGILFQVHGMMVGILLSSLILAYQEISFTRSQYFKIGYHDLLRPLGINALLLMPVVALETVFVPKHIDLLHIFYYFSAFSGLNFIVTVIISYTLHREPALLLQQRFTSLFMRSTTLSCIRSERELC